MPTTRSKRKQKNVVKESLSCEATAELPEKGLSMNSTDEFPEKELSLSSLYDMIVGLQESQKTFQDTIGNLIVKQLNEYAEKFDNRSDSATKFVENMWSDISSCIGVLGGKLDLLEKQFDELHSAENRANKIIIKGVPDEIADESLKEFISTMFASLDEDIKDFTAERICINDKPGPVKVHLKTEEGVNRILRKKRSLREIEEFKTVFVNPCLSKQQRKIDFNFRQIAKVVPKVRYSGGRVQIKT